MPDTSRRTTDFEILHVGELPPQPTKKRRGKPDSVLQNLRELQESTTIVIGDWYRVAEYKSLYGARKALTTISEGTRHGLDDIDVERFDFDYREHTESNRSELLACVLDD